MGRVKGKNLRAFKIIIFAIVLTVICTCSAVSAANLRVSSAIEGSYISIQAAVDAAKAGDTIFVSPGMYVENLKIDREISIWSDSRNPENTVIRAADPKKSTVEIRVDRVSFSGFGIEGSEKAGILLIGVKSCYINNNRAQGAEYGILLNNSESNTISNNIITLNKKGIRLESSDSNTMEDNIVAYNYGQGISLEESSRNIVFNNYFKNAENVEEKVVNPENIWQSPLVTRQNIVRGPYIAGNFWADPEGKGYSETCADENSNGVCDSSYNITGGGTDKSPLFPKVPTAIKTLESKLNTSSYEQDLAGKENATGVEIMGNETEGTTEQAGENATNVDTSTSEKEAPGPGLGIAVTALGTAYFLKRKR
ncbi:NosD domain-containing protein [Methanosarcina sp. Z-7115]|uniref:NosD domain-containing protein n=1 Tax=Methanosarcina baikalica TaxID=3073890 RepID=A0ABU2D0V7_9EURY|nr:NosD domain-containing protein [Methanosarcina sp. Z-7115]MDR7665611.1 NosD domain-containing protein [Methanosarcina sp. Z-7115]